MSISTMPAPQGVPNLCSATRTMTPFWEESPPPTVLHPRPPTTHRMVCTTSSIPRGIRRRHGGIRSRHAHGYSLPASLQPWYIAQSSSSSGDAANDDTAMQLCFGDRARCRSRSELRLTSQQSELTGQGLRANFCFTEPGFRQRNS